MIKRILIIIKIELEKLLRQRFVYTLFGFVVLLVIIASIFRQQLSNIESLNLSQSNGFEMMASASKWGLRLGAYLFLLLSIHLLSDEYADHTLKTILTRPIQRSEYILGKSGVILILTCVLMLILAASSFICAMLFSEFGDLTERGYVFYTWGRLARQFFYAYLLLIPTMLTVGLLGLFISVLIQKSGTAIVSGLGLLFLLNIVTVIDEIKNFVFTTFLLFPLETVSKMASRLYPQWTPGLYWLFGNALIYSGLFIYFSIWIFKKRDILT